MIISGAATAGNVDNVLLWLWYEKLKGVDGHFLGADEVKGRIERLTLLISLSRLRRGRRGLAPLRSMRLRTCCWRIGNMPSWAR